MLQIIANVDQNRVIGVEDQLAYYIPEDLAFFKEQTLGRKVLCGSNTYNQLRHLKGREWVQLTRENCFSQLYLASQSSEVIICGGGKIIYDIAIDFASVLLISEPKITKEFKPWHLLHKFPVISDSFQLMHSQDRETFTLKIYQRISNVN